MQGALDGLAEERDLPLVGRMGSARGDGRNAPAADARASAETGGSESPRAGGDGDSPAGEGGADASAGEQEATAATDGEQQESDAVDAPPPAAWLPRTPRRGAPAARGGAGDGGELPAAERGRDGAPRADAPVAPAEEEDAVVAELADVGAGDGAGAELHVDEPWDGYGSMRAGEIVERLREASSETLAAVQLYEQTHRQRRGVVSAVERELKRR